MLLGFACAAAAFVAYLSTTGAMGNFVLVGRFLRGYASIELGSPSAWFRNMLRGVAVHASDNYSLALSIATIAGIGLTILKPAGFARSIGAGEQLQRLAAIFFLCLLASVMVEGKFYHYHFSRIYPFGAILAAAALARGAAWVAGRGTGGAYGVAMHALMAAALLIFGPLPRYAWQCVPMITTLRGGSAALDGLYDRIGSYYPRSELRAVGHYVAAHRRPGDEMFTGSSIGALVHYFAGDVPAASIYHSAFYMASFTPPQFRETTRRYLLDRHPAFVVMQTNDTTADISGVRDATSASALLALPGIDSLMRTDYEIVMRTKFFAVYRWGVDGR
jgi:hypothetical protein